MADTATAYITLDGGIVRVCIRDGVHQRPPDARQNLEEALRSSGGRRCPLLVDIRRCPPLDAETRHEYSGQHLVDGFTALALLIEASPLGRTIGNVYLRVARPGIPTQLFTADLSAVEWLQRFQS